jgi:cysteinyl-tRNA synthetase
MNDDLNTPVAIAHLFDAVRIINLVNDGKESLSETDIKALSGLFDSFLFEILGLRIEDSSSNDKLAGVVKLLLDIRQDAKEKKEWAVSDQIRENLNAMGITVKDRKDGYDWEITS